jgi:WD40-like Beta Propeller Repeat
MIALPAAPPAVPAGHARFPVRLRAVRRASVLLAALPLLAACHSSGGASAQPTVTVTQPAGSTGGGSENTAAPSSSPTQASMPGIVAVTTAGALVRLDPSTGNITQTLVAGGVLGDEISVSPDGSTVYFAQRSGACDMNIESVSINGGTPTPIASGELPAISPDGTKLAFAQEPLLTQDCIPNQSNLTPFYKLVVRTLSSGAEQTLPLPPQVQKGGLFLPISHLSWGSDNVSLAVSTSAVQDNEGWGLYLVNTATARYYAPPGPGILSVPVTGSPTAERSYIREGIYLPDGNLFISRACCGGFPIHNTSRLMWEVAPNGVLVHTVAIGFPQLEHVSLAADPSGQWLLYIGGTDLYVSQGGNTPSKRASGLIAAAWI